MHALEWFTPLMSLVFAAFNEIAAEDGELDEIRVVVRTIICCFALGLLLVTTAADCRKRSNPY